MANNDQEQEPIFRMRFGKMIKGVDPLLLPEDAVSDTQNMIPCAHGWKQRKGSSELTAAAVASGLKFKSLFHFRQLNESGDMILAHVYDSVNGERIMKGSALPPNAITWSALKTLTAGCDVSSFAQVGDAVVIANAKEYLIWRGTEHKPTAVWKYINAQTAYVNFFEEATDEDSTTHIPLDALTTSDKLLVFSDQPLNTLIVTMGSNVNANDADMTLKKFNGSWVALTITDGTSKEITQIESDNFNDSSLAAFWTFQDLGGNGSVSETTTLNFNAGDGAITGATFTPTWIWQDAINGDFTVTLKVTKWASGGANRQCGLLLIPDDGGTDDSVQLVVHEIAGPGWRVQRLDRVANVNKENNTAYDKANYWLKLARSGANFVTSYSENGTDWNVLSPPAGAYTTTAPVKLGIGCWNSGAADFTATIDDFVVVAGGTVQCTLGQTGNVTWTAATDEKPYLLNGIMGYAYEMTVSAALSATVDVSALKVASPMNTVRDIWGGTYLACAGCKVTTDGSTYQDYTGEVGNEVTTEVAILDGLTSANGKAYFGFDVPVQMILIYVPPGKGNGNAATATLKYRKNDGTWGSLTITDTTAVSGKTLAQSGYLSWTPPTDEKPCSVAGDVEQLYWYQFYPSADLDAEVEIYFVQGIPAPDDPVLCQAAGSFKRRALQVAPRGYKNAIRYSALDLPNTWNGEDSGYFAFGDRPLKVGIPFYNEYLVYCDTEFWLWQGESPATFDKLRLSAIIGIDAPRSLISIETGIVVNDNIRRVVGWIFQGLWFFDGVRWWIVSAPDIDTFFDPNSTDYINPTYLDQCYGAFDFTTQCAYWVVYSGSTQTTPNKVIVLHVPTMTYGIFSYPISIASLVSVVNTGRYYLCGGGNSTGKFYYMNTGNTDADATGTATAIEAYIVSKELFASYNVGLQKQLLWVLQEAQTGGRVDVSVYPDGSKTDIAVGHVSMVERGKRFANKKIEGFKDWPKALSARLKFSNTTKGQPWNPFAFSLNWKPSRPDK